MIRIKVPATSANLGPGFDALGIALNLYNEFIFEKSNEFIFDNVLEAYANSDNLIIKASLKTYDYLQINPIKYKLSTRNKIPSARGLGSSATCIVAGILAAEYFSRKKLSKEEIIKIGTEIEGHPDNIAPAVLGMLTSAVVNDKVYVNKYYVNQQFIFTVVIPNFKLRTEDARKVLPDKLPYSDFLYSLSRAINIPTALKNGNEAMLFEMLKDKIHEPYRYPLINDSEKYLEYSEKNKVPFCISGSGSCLLFISKKSIKKDIENINKDYRIKELRVSHYGGRIYEK